ncbi:MAG: fumarylacetoacetate hydrolase family protein [Candidatus Micrarchaeia archaeon]
MKIGIVSINKKRTIAVKADSGIVPLEVFLDMLKIDSPGSVLLDDETVSEINAILQKKELYKDFIIEEDSVNYYPPIEKPGKIIGIGINYRKHAAETGMAIPKEPILFSKFNNAIAANGQEIRIPNVTKELDYEGELAIVIGKSARNVEKDEAFAYVFGYTIANDVTARDLQFMTGQWLLGKTLDGFAPIGPYITTRSDIPNPNNLTIKTYVNGEIRQDSNTSDMIFKCDELISYISNFFTLEPGDIILTGTPSGVIYGMPKDKQVWLKHNDEVRIEIENIGTLANKFQ